MAEFARSGLGDAQVLPFASLGPSLSELEESLEVFKKAHTSSRGFTHFGFASGKDVASGRFGLVALFSRRLVSTGKLRATVKKKRETVNIFPGADYQVTDAKIVGFLATPKGRIEKFSISRNWINGQAAMHLGFNDGPGEYIFEIMVDGPRGPEASILWRYNYGDQKSRTRDAPEKLKLPDTRSTLRALLRRTRTQSKLPLLKENVGLNAAAQAHANQVCKQRLAAHILPGGDAPGERIRKHGFQGLVSENVAMAQTVGRAYQNLLQSPSHLANIINPNARELGLGLAYRESQASSSRYDQRPARSWCVVQLFGVPR
jgi:hypothetical protein